MIPIELIIEATVAVLLMFTIGYSCMLSRRLKRLSIQENEFRQTVKELMRASKQAEDAIASLNNLASESGRLFDTRLLEAEKQSATLAYQIDSSAKILKQMSSCEKAAAENPAKPKMTSGEQSATRFRPSAPGAPNLRLKTGIDKLNRLHNREGLKLPRQEIRETLRSTEARLLRRNSSAGRNNKISAKNADARGFAA